jgi:hypothetical protein
MNKICESLDIDLRFNDDEVRSGEKGYRTLFLQNNLTETVPEKIKNIVVRNSCSIITKNNKPVQSSLTINKILQGNSQCFNADADNENDKIILKGSEIAIIASEQSPFGGRIILLGSTNLLLNDSFNHNEKHQTEDFVLWLPEFVTEKMTFTKNPKILLSQIFRLKNEDTRIQEKLSILLEKWEEVLTTEEFKDKTPQIAKEFHKRYINCNLEKQKILDNFRLTIIESLQNLSLNSNQENPELENLLLKLRLLD